MQKAKRLFVTLMYRMTFIKTVILATLMILTIFMLVYKESDADSEADYKAACKLISVAELTKNSTVYAGQKFKITGEVVAFEETTDQKSGNKITMLVIGVNDYSSGLSGGKLPVFVLYVGATSAFINDIVTIYGDFFGNDMPKLKSVEKKNLPRINAKFIIIESKKKKK